MRNIKSTTKKCLAVISAICIVSNGALASESVADAVYNSVSGKLEISGNGVQNSQVAVMVVPYTLDTGNITEEEANAGNVIFNVAQIDHEGNYELKMGLRDNWGGGLYKAVIGGEELIFTYADSKKLKSALGDINKGDEKDIFEALTAKASDLGADALHIQKYGKDIAAYLYKNKHSAGYGENAFLKTYTAALALCMVRGGEYTLAEAVSKLSGYMEVDPSVTYSDDIMADAQRIIGLMDMSGGSVKEMYDEAVAVAHINLSETNAQMQSVALKEEYKDIFNLDFKDYDKISNDYKKLLVFSSLLNEEFDSAEQYAARFEESAKTVRDSDTGPEQVSGGGGGSGGGKGSGGGVSGGGISGGSVISNTPSAQTTAGYFSDMSGHWGSNAVNTLVSRGIIGGYPDGTFKPENNVTRAEFAKMLALALKIPTSASESDYKDVNSADWYAPYVAALSERGIITGWNGMFEPDGKITRQDAAVMTYRAAKDLLGGSEVQAVFSDETNISDYAKDAVTRLSALKIINGYDGRFEPTNNTTRAQAATIICNVLSACGIN